MKLTLPTAVHRFFALRTLRRAIKMSLTEQVIAVEPKDDKGLTILREAAIATILLQQNATYPAQKAFSRLYKNVKNGSDTEHQFVRLYCLYYLAAIRGAHSDCFYYASRARKMSGTQSFRRALRMPSPVERNIIGAAIVKMQ